MDVMTLCKAFDVQQLREVRQARCPAMSGGGLVAIGEQRSAGELMASAGMHIASLLLTVTKALLYQTSEIRTRPMARQARGA
jgi:hypothetical protein